MKRYIVTVEADNEEQAKQKIQQMVNANQIDLREEAQTKNQPQR